MKNELIVAQYKNLPRKHAEEKLHALIEELGLTELSSRFLN